MDHIETGEYLVAEFQVLGTGEGDFPERMAFYGHSRTDAVFKGGRAVFGQGIGDELEIGF